MHQVEQKRLLVERILPYLNGAPDDVVQRLLQKSVSDLETILGDAITTKARTEATERVTQHAADMRAESASEAAWTHACRALINGKRMAIVQSNRDLLESLTNPGETPSAKLYIALAQQYPQRFAWSSPPTQTDEERRAEFVSICRQNNLSECDANEKLHKAGSGIDHWAGASQVELQEFQADAALARQKWLVRSGLSTMRARRNCGPKPGTKHKRTWWRTDRPMQMQLSKRKSNVINTQVTNLCPRILIAKRSSRLPRTIFANGRDSTVNSNSTRLSEPSSKEKQ